MLGAPRGFAAAGQRHEPGVRSQRGRAGVVRGGPAVPSGSDPRDRAGPSAAAVGGLGTGCGQRRGACGDSAHPPRPGRAPLT